MSTVFEEIKNKAIALSDEEKAELAHELIISLDKAVDSDIEEAWDIEIKKRVDEIKSGRAKGRPAKEILAEIKAKYS